MRRESPRAHTRLAAAHAASRRQRVQSGKPSAHESCGLKALSGRRSKARSFSHAESVTRGPSSESKASQCSSCQPADAQSASSASSAVVGHDPPAQGVHSSAPRDAEDGGHHERHGGRPPHRRGRGQHARSLEAGRFDDEARAAKGHGSQPRHRSRQGSQEGGRNVELRRGVTARRDGVSDIRRDHRARRRRCGDREARRGPDEAEEDGRMRGTKRHDCELAVRPRSRARARARLAVGQRSSARLDGSCVYLALGAWPDAQGAVAAVAPSVASADTYVPRSKFAKHRRRHVADIRRVSAKFAAHQNSSR